MTDQQQQYPHIDDSLLQPVEASREEFDGLLEELRTEVSLADAEAALVDSARHNEADVVRAILTVYPHAIHSALDAHRNSPLHMAAANGHVDLVTLLLRCGADASTCNEKGNTPLHWAASNGQQAVVDVLLQQAHVDVLQRNSFGKSALSAGFESQNTNVVQSLLEHETASEERLLQTNADNAPAGTATDTTATSSSLGVTHEFRFGRDRAVSVRIRELPMAQTDQDSILGQANPLDDTTGLGVWAASLVTAQWLLDGPCRDRLVQCRTMLELGAGCGIPSLAVAQLLQSAASPALSRDPADHAEGNATATPTIYATDFNPRTVDNLRHNVTLNEGAVGRVQALEMNWRDPSTWPKVPGGMEVLVGSDLIYQSDMVPVLLQTVTSLLADDGVFFYVAPATGRQGQAALMEGLAAAGFRQQVHPLDSAYKANPLASGDDDECFVHFHELPTAEWKLYQFSRR